MLITAKSERARETTSTALCFITLDDDDAYLVEADDRSVNQPKSSSRQCIQRNRRSPPLNEEERRESLNQV